MSSRFEIEKLWRHEKYRVMYHSQAHYNQVRELLKVDAEFTEVENIIKEAIQTKPTNGSVINTYQHMWGYFKKHATIQEKALYQQQLEQFQNGGLTGRELLSFIRSLAKKYEVEYLLNSSILQHGEEKL